jgi:hypothetical protein
MVCRAQVSLEAELPIAFRSTARRFTSGLAAGGAELVAVASYLSHMTGPM